MLAAAPPALAATASDKGVFDAGTFDIGDGRRYVAHPPAGTPPGTPPGSLPVLLVLGGGGAEAEEVLAAQGWTGTADASGFLAAGLEPLPPDRNAPPTPLLNPRLWNDGAAPRDGPDDVAYVRAVLDDLARRFPVDPARVYAVGFGDGGAMVQRLVAEMPDRLAAAASVAGHLHLAAAPHLAERQARPVPLMLVFGGSDPLLPLQGGRISAPGIADHEPPAVLTTVGRWIDRLGCPAAPAAALDGPRVERRLWAPCAGSAELSVVLVRDLGHHWPGGGGGGPLPTRLTGPTSDAVNGTAEIWAFLRRHARDDRARGETAQRETGRRETGR